MKVLFRFPLALLLSLSLMHAQSVPQKAPQKQSPSTATAVPQTSGSDAAFASPTATSNQELTHVANEAAGRTPQDAGVGSSSETATEHEDAEAAFKYSAPVRGIARITGLSLTAAYWLCVFINFGVVAVLIILAMKSNLPAMLRGRTQEIQKGMEEARRSSQEAQRRLQEIEARLAKLSLEIGEMEKHAESDSRAEEERIRASIDEEKHKILEAAQQEVGQATNAARRELQKYAVALAVEMAEKGIRIDTKEDKLLVDDFAEQLGGEARRNGAD
jgi:F-type H+-transporting ATPase subunit b